MSHIICIISLYLRKVIVWYFCLQVELQDADQVLADAEDQFLQEQD